MSEAVVQAAPSSPSRGTAWKIVATVVVVTAGVGTLLYASAREDMAFYRHVDEVMASPDTWRGKNMQVHGFMRELRNKPGSLEYRFTLESRPPRGPATIVTNYEGILPDTAKEGSEVIATGVIGPDNVLKASAISAQCPSKYDPAKKVAAPSYGGPQAAQP